MEETHRKKLRLSPSLGSATDDHPENEEESCDESASLSNPNSAPKSDRFSFDISMEEEKFLDDSGIDLRCSKEADSKFEVRRIRRDEEMLRVAERQERHDGDHLKHSRCRGEMPETDVCGEAPDACMDVCEAADGGEAKRTPDKSLFKTVEEKLLYECSLTPKKVKKKCYDANRDM